MKRIKLSTDDIIGFSHDGTIRVSSVFFIHKDDLKKILEIKTQKNITSDFNTSDLCEIYIKLQDDKK